MTTRAPRPSTLLVVVGSMLAALLGTAHAGAVPVEAPRAVKVAGSLKTSATPVPAGSTVTLRGNLPPRRSRLVKLQQHVDGRWTPLAEARSSARGRFRFEVQVSEGTSRYRALARRARINGKRYAAVRTPWVEVTGEAPTGNGCSTPPHALATVRPDTTDASTRSYGGLPVRGQCDAAPADLEPWWGYATSTGRYYSAVDEAGNLVEMVADIERLTVSVRDPLTYAELSTKSVALGSWGEVGNVIRAADGGFFVLLGRANPEEDADAVVLQVRRYDEELKLLGTASVRSGIEPWLGVRRPFVAGSASMVEREGTLVVHLARLMTKADDGVNHQANLTLDVDIATMTATLVDGTYTSHSFNQFVVARGDDAVFVDHGDAYPRSLVMTVISGFFTSATGEERHDVLDLPGAVGDNYTGTTVNGLAVGTDRALTTGVSVPHGNAVGGVTGSGSESDYLLRNAYVISTDLETGTSTHRWLTTYDPHRTDVAVTEPRIVELDEDAFVVLFGVRTSKGDSTEYRLVNAAGELLGSASFPGLAFQPLAEPVVSGSRLFWVGAHQWDVGFDRRGSHHLYGLDLGDPVAPDLLEP